MSQIVDILKAMDALLATEKQWTQGTFARNVYGDDCSPYSPSAVSWCLAGATVKNVGNGEDIFITSLYEACGGVDASIFNDAPERTFEDIKYVIAKAIKIETACTRAEKNEPTT